MDIAVSKELRWFLEDDQTVPIEDWFGHLDTPQKFGDRNLYPRQDYYLSIPEVKNLGVKIREPKKDAVSGKRKTKLEIKQQLSENEPIEMINDNKAYTNKWQKFSYALTEGEESVLNVNFLFPSSDRNWIRVDKDRLIAKYDAATKSIVNGKTLVNEGCGVELTRIKVSRKAYQTFGLEAFSESGKRLDDNFMECCNVIFKSIKIEGLKLKDSLSYPEFFTSLQTLL